MKTYKDYYSLLGVAKTASLDEIRAAYIARTRIIHPDRFNRESEPVDWNNANKMLRELNEAFEVLRNPARRLEYDKACGAGEKSQTNRQSSGKTANGTTSGSGNPRPLKAGVANFKTLPRSTQLMLKRRQSQDLPDQFRVGTRSTLPNYGCIAGAVGWFCYLIFAAIDEKWTDEVIWYAAFTVTAGLLLAANALTLFRTLKSPLKSSFYITPLHFIDVAFDIVSFWPIWRLDDLSITHNHTNGTYQSSTIRLKFDDESMALTIPSKERVEAFLDKLKSNEVRARSAAANGNFQYFVDNDYFSEVDVRTAPVRSDLSTANLTMIYSAIGVTSIVFFAVAYQFNQSHAVQTWVRHSTKDTSTTSNFPARQPQASPLNTTAMPVVERAPTFSIPEQSAPANGSKQVYDHREAIAPFAIQTAPGSNYFVKLINLKTQSTCLTVFVRGGMSVEVDVPIGTYEVRYASGDKWYGYAYLFGPSTSYSKADSVFDFRVDGDKISGYTISLYRVPHGNLHTSTIPAESF